MSLFGESCALFVDFLVVVLISNGEKNMVHDSKTTELWILDLAREHLDEDLRGDCLCNMCLLSKFVIRQNEKIKFLELEISHHLEVIERFSRQVEPKKFSEVLNLDSADSWS